MAHYYPVVQHLTEDKNQEKLLENEEAIIFLDETKTNDNSNDSDSSNTHLNQPEEATTKTKANTGPAEETQEDSKEEEEEEERRVTRWMTAKQLVSLEEKTEEMERKSRHQVDRRIQRNKIQMGSWRRQKQRQRKQYRKEEE
mmetsp:Transcript_68673/g.76806  ORF Transcript_68673/g.76806 Transcript_68673/m.76806 type:complete len:142 (+) Transcript_68673:172-597(+)